MIRRLVALAFLLGALTAAVGPASAPVLLDVLATGSTVGGPSPPPHPNV
jgi:hypothetical protein